MINDEVKTYFFDGVEIKYIIKKSSGRNIHLKLEIDNVLHLRINDNIDRKEIDNILSNCNKWIINQLKFNNMIREKYDYINLKERKKAYLFGDFYNINVTDENNLFEIDNSKKMITTCNIKTLYKDIFIHCRKEVEELFIECYFEMKNILVNKPILLFKKAKSIWGQCFYNKNTVYLNERIICLNKEEIKFIIKHEFTHFIEKKHDKAFYNQLGFFEKNHKIIRNNLKEKGFLLDI